MAEVISLEVGWHGEVAPDDVLEGAKTQLGSVVVIGRQLIDGDFYFASSMGKLSEINLLISQLQHKILRGDYEV